MTIQRHEHLRKVIKGELWPVQFPFSSFFSSLLHIFTTLPFHFFCNNKNTHLLHYYLHSFTTTLTFAAFFCFASACIYTHWHSLLSRTLHSSFKKKAKHIFKHPLPSQSYNHLCPHSKHAQEMTDTDASTVASTVAYPHPPNAADTSSLSKKLPWYKRLDQQRGILLFVICLAQMLDIISIASVTIALPSILRDVKYAPNQLQWVVSSYALTYAAFLLVGGRMVSLFAFCFLVPPPHVSAEK